MLDLIEEVFFVHLTQFFSLVAVLLFGNMEHLAALVLPAQDLIYHLPD